MIVNNNTKAENQSYLRKFEINEVEFVSVCRTCHGTYPHYSDEKTRSFMNIHSKRMACESCHIRPMSQIKELKKVIDWRVPSVEDRRIIDAVSTKNMKRKPIVYKWYNGNLDIISSPLALEGDNGSKILPFKKGKKGRLTVLRVDERTRELPRGYDVSPIAIECKECHVKKGLIDFVELGYAEKPDARFPKGRVENMQKLREFEMLQKWEKFLIPSLF